MWYRDHISQQKNVCGGKPVVKGTRVLISSILSYLAAGKTEAEILEDFPTLKARDVQAVAAFAANCAMFLAEATPDRFEAVAARKAPKPRVIGGAKGLFRMSADFDDPLPDDIQKAFEGPS